MIEALEKEEKTISEDREKVYEKIRELRKQLDQGVCYYTFSILQLPFSFLL